MTNDNHDKLIKGNLQYRYNKFLPIQTRQKHLFTLFKVYLHYVQFPDIPIILASS